jgi:hypothetical protein
MSATVAALAVVLQREQAPAMEELRRELAAARRDNAILERQLAQQRAAVWSVISGYGDRDDQIARAGDRLARWALQRRLAEGVPVPDEIWSAVRLMRRDAEAEDDLGMAVEMAVDSAAAP